MASRLYNQHGGETLTSTFQNVNRMNQGVSATTTLERNPWEPLLGKVPYHEGRQNPLDSRTVEHYNFPQAYLGESEKLRDDIQYEAFITRYTAIGTILLPFKYMKGAMVAHWDDWVRVISLLDANPEEVGPTLLATRRTSGRVMARRYNKGFSMGLDNMTTPKGQEEFQMKIATLADATYLTVYHYGFQSLLDRGINFSSLYTNKPRGVDEFRHMEKFIAEDVATYGICTKTAGGTNQLIVKAKKRGKENMRTGRDFDTIIFPCEMSVADGALYDRQKHIYAIHDHSAKEQLNFPAEKTVEHATVAGMKAIVYHTTTLDSNPNHPIAQLRSNRSVGQMLTFETPKSGKYVSGMRNRVWNDYELRDWVETDFAEVIDNMGIWNGDGTFDSKFLDCFDTLLEGGFTPEEKRQGWMTLDRWMTVICQGDETEQVRIFNNIKNSNATVDVPQKYANLAGNYGMEGVKGRNKDWKDLPVVRDSIKMCLARGWDFPIGGVVFRPNATTAMGKIILTVSGKDTGGTMIGRSFCRVGKTAALGILLFHFMFWFASYVKKPQNVMILDHACFMGYEYGADTKFGPWSTAFDPRKQSCLAMFDMPGHNKARYGISAGKSCLTGKFHDRSPFSVYNKHRRDQGQRCVFADYYATKRYMGQLPGQYGTQWDLTAYKWNPQYRPDLCLETVSYLPRLSAGDTVEFTRRRNGCDHWGPRQTPAARDAIDNWAMWPQPRLDPDSTISVLGAES